MAKCEGLALVTLAKIEKWSREASEGWDNLGLGESRAQQHARRSAVMTHMMSVPCLQVCPPQCQDAQRKQRDSLLPNLFFFLRARGKTIITNIESHCDWQHKNWVWKLPHVGLDERNRVPPSSYESEQYWRHCGVYCRVGTVWVLGVPPYGSLIYILDAWAPVIGRFLGITTGWDPGVCKSNR